jgi:hyperosmotically inducible protein
MSHSNVTLLDDRQNGDDPKICRRPETTGARPWASIGRAGGGQADKLPANMCTLETPHYQPRPIQEWRTEMKLRTLFLACTILALGSAVFGRQAAEPSARATERIIREVRHELLMLPYFGVFDNIAYKVDGYNVTLMGQVSRPTLKSDAENVVKRIEGVEHVDNQIEVLPVSPSDDRLRLRLYRAIYGFPALQKYALGVQKPIRIIVKSGHVTLEGVVDNDADKNIANIRANGVSGAFSITNNLQVVKP